MRRGVLSIAIVLLTLIPAAGATASTAPDSTQALASRYLEVTLAPAREPDVAPPGFAITPRQAAPVAERSPKAQAIHRSLHPLRYLVYLWGGHYEVFFYYRGKAVADVLVYANGRLGPTYTGGLMIGVYARGHYDSLFDSPWVFLPFTAMFLLALVGSRGGMAKLDVAAVLGFAISYWLFDTRRLDAAVWLAYPPLLFVMVRMLMRGGLLRRRPDRRRREGRAAHPAALRPALPLGILTVGLGLLVTARVILNLEHTGVIDVAYSSLLGADRILHGQGLYHGALAHADTYGPIVYLAYLPFQALWDGAWSSAPAAHAAAIAFDLLTIAGLVQMGRRLRGGSEGLRLGLLLGWLWAACPFTLLGLLKSTNDGLVALLLVAMMLTLTLPVARGALLGLASAAKFVPAVLLPLVAAGIHRERRSSTRTAVAFGITVGVAILILLPPGGIAEMYDRTLGYQLSRSDIFSAWALHPGLEPLKVAVEVVVCGLAVLVAFRPRGRRTLAQVAALAASLMIAVQLPAVHWFYLYIVWFFPLVLVAVAGAGREVAPDSDAAPPTTERAPEDPSRSPADPERQPVLVGAG